MQRLLSIFLIVLMTLGLMMQDANAKRFGGGRSFGMQGATSSTFSRAQNINSQQPFQQKNRWLGPLAGFAAGSLLTSLFMGHGMGSGILSWILIAGLAFVVWNFLRNRFQVSPQSNNYNNVSQMPNSLNAFHNTYNATPNNDESDFLREAKVQFIRLQAAYDNKNLNDIREFSTPEVFAEIQLQLQERGDASNITEVVSVNAELLDASLESKSVRFTGMIKEEINAAASAFSEVWHFRKNQLQNGWVVSGIQQ